MKDEKQTTQDQVESTRRSNCTRTFFASIPLDQMGSSGGASSVVLA